LKESKYDDDTVQGLSRRDAIAFVISSVLGGLVAAPNANAAVTDETDNFAVIIGGQAT
jgi:hypothetical protein